MTFGGRAGAQGEVNHNERANKSRTLGLLPVAVADDNNNAYTQPLWLLHCYWTLAD
jgi:hypothetical protein